MYTVDGEVMFTNIIDFIEHIVRKQIDTGEKSFTD